mmetsp:Transcript_133804/g.286170  ORF Transcript_133804/g.286170 Transcript_133804/m.286170 type:complete len:910 (-) Transcript_133804:76-2805(-)
MVAHRLWWVLPWLLLRCRPLLASDETQGGAPERELQAFNPSSVPYFARHDESVYTSVQDVVKGELRLSAEVPMGLVAELGVTVKQAFIEITGVPETSIIQAISGDFNVSWRPGTSIPQQYLRIKYLVLPNMGAVWDVRDQIDVAGRGAGVPPVQPFMTILLAKMALYGPTTALLPTHGWSAELPRPGVERMQVHHPVGWQLITTTPIVPLATTTAGTGIAGTGTVAAPSYMSDPCLQATMACTCASMNCSWVAQASGRYACQSGVAGGGVACGHCPTQVGCARCGESLTACGCAASEAQCRWDEASFRCVENFGGMTPCSACVAQSHCRPPQISWFWPTSGTKLELPLHWWLKITFDREIRMGTGGEVSFKCTGQARKSQVPRDHLSTDSHALLVGVGVLVEGSHDEERQCDLILSPGIITDIDRVPFMGLEIGVYKFRLGDTTAPEVLVFDPRNGETGVALHRAVTFTFTERIRLSPSAAQQNLVVSTLETAEPGGNGTARQTALIGLSSSRVALQATRLSLDLTGLAASGALYSVSLPRGSVVDLSDNQFAGLPTSAYFFRIAPAAITTQSEISGGLDQTQLFALVGAGSAIVFLCACVCWRFRRLQRVHAVYLQKSRSKLNAVRPVRESSVGRTEEASLHGGSASAKAPQTPKNQAPLKSFNEDPLNSTWGSQPFNSTWSSSYSQADLWASSVDSPTRRSKSNFYGASEVLPGRKSDSQLRAEAQRRWNEAFAAQKAKAAAGPAPTGERSRPRAQSGPVGTSAQAAASAFYNAAHRQRVPPPGGPAAKAPNSPTSPPPPGGSRRDSTSSIPSDREAPSGGGGSPKGERIGSKVSLESASNEPPEVKRKKAQVEKRLRELMDAPLAERKKTLKELMLEYHPDKNNDLYAKDVFQFVNASKGWFLNDA